MDAFEILVVILSVTLAIFLVLAIIATSYIIYVLNKLKSIADHTEVIAENIEAASNKFKSIAGPAAIFSLIPKIVKMRKK